MDSLVETNIFSSVQMIPNNKPTAVPQSNVHSLGTSFLAEYNRENKNHINFKLNANVRLKLKISENFK